MTAKEVARAINESKESDNHKMDIAITVANVSQDDAEDFYDELYRIAQLDAVDEWSE